MSDDTSVAQFKQWLRTRQRMARRDAVDELGKRLIKDSRIPAQGSKGLYMAHMRASGYSAEDKATFEIAWAEMRQEAKA